MKRRPANSPGSVASSVRMRVMHGGERVWRLEDLSDLPFPAVARALSRLTKDGLLERLSKGVYYRSRKTAFGKSRPNPATIRKLVLRGKTAFPAGVAAANLLGLSTQSSKHIEIATSGLSLPRQLLGGDLMIYTRRPEAWKNLSQTEAALLDFLRRRGETSDLSPEATIRQLLKLLSQRGCFGRLLRVADTEPPRVRAMLGAIGEQLGKSTASLKRLRGTLSPLSRYDFGKLSGLSCASRWQATKRP